MSESDMQAKSAKPADIVLRAHKVAKIYKEGDLRTDVLHDVSFSVKRGETASIVARTGKSTCCIFGGLDTATGEVEVEGQVMPRLSDRACGQLRNRSLGFIYQFHHLLLEFTALENVCMPCSSGTPTPRRAHWRPSCLAGGLAARTRTSRVNSAAASASVQRWLVLVTTGLRAGR
jgi:lipoprotein-releasing system ATP-binding protein